MGKQRLALFDYDGTIRDSSGVLLKYYNSIFIKNNLGELLSSDLYKVAGLSSSAVLDKLFPQLKKSDRNRILDELEVAYRELYHSSEHGFKTPIYEGIDKVIDCLKSEGWILVIATGAGSRDTEIGLYSCGLLDKFSSLYTASNSLSKPDPDMINKALHDFSIEPENAVMIGDSIYDIIMAHRASIKSIGVSWGVSSYDVLMSNKPNAIVNNSKELYELLIKII